MRSMPETEPDESPDTSTADPAKVVLPEASLAPTALPSAIARGLAFVAVILAGVCGGLVGWAVTDLQCDGDCGTQTTLGALGGTLLAAGGVAVIAVLTLRAMAEWNQQASIRQRR